MSALILYALSVYCLYHVLSRSDLLSRPRAWAVKVLPKRMVYVLSCCFCFTFHVGWILPLIGTLFTGTLALSVTYLLAAPVVNLIVDQVVQYLLRYNAPPVFTIHPTSYTGCSPSPDGVKITYHNEPPSSGTSTS